MLALSQEGLQAIPLSHVAWTEFLWHEARTRGAETPGFVFCIFLEGVPQRWHPLLTGNLLIHF
eukprot:12401409-Karenia_brevis.AAC.1